ncbi:hypothetical protein F4777DRAFT_579909 [Nemania sp. FL0916]|nr:hypothetical protein F4777DRAFT_579909 [Nemania sp. FL0916]
MPPVGAPVHPDDLGCGPLILGVIWTFAIIAILVVAERFDVQCKVADGPALEDWLMDAAVVGLQQLAEVLHGHLTLLTRQPLGAPRTHR